MSIVQEAYNQWSTSYDQDHNLTRDLDAQVTKEALANVQWGDVLELGSGTGKNTLLLAEIAQNVHALDFSPKMMAKAKAKITAENVQFTQTDLTQPWPYPDHTADLIVCNLVLEHIEDLALVQLSGI